MIKSYFKMTLRSLMKNKGYSFINIIGLSTGIAVAILVGLWMKDELSFDSYFSNHESIAEVMVVQSNEGQSSTGTTISSMIADPLQTKYGSDFQSMSLASYESEYFMSVEDRMLSSTGMSVQKSFPEMFTLNMIQGTRGALSDPSTMLISMSLSKSLFGEANPINKTIRLNNKFDMTIGGVFEDFPNNTTFSNTKFLLPWEHPDNYNNSITEWRNHHCLMFVQLEDPANINEVIEKIKGLPMPYITGWKEELTLQPLDRLHLYNEFKEGKSVNGRIELVWMLGIIGGFILLLACINFMNLSTARSEKRAKEVGIRKTIGSVRSQLISQFLVESIVVAMISLMVAMMLVQLSLPFFNSIANKKMTILWSEPFFWFLILGFALFAGILSGSYPAFYLSSFKPIKVLKGTFKSGSMAALPRKILVVLQFTVSVTLIIGTTIIFKQIEYAKDRPVGYSREGLITVRVNTDELRDHYDVVRHEILQTGVIENVASSSQSPAHFRNNNSIDWQGKDPALTIFFRNVNVSSDFGKTIGWKIIEGRDFSGEILSDSSAVIFNKSAIDAMHLEAPLGQVIKFRDKEYTIVGITDDMLTQSPYDPLEPSFFIMKKSKSVIVLRIRQDISPQEAFATIEPIFKKHNPSAPFVYNFVDLEYGKKFADEQRVANLATAFALLAIFISCLGLSGLASFVAEQRTKEIGIRKVMGASVTNLWKLLSKDFVILVIVSCAISVPIASHYLEKWLMKYKYHTDISWWVLFSTCLGALIITLLTVSYQSLKAAIANPVKSLRSE
ncbi:MAG: FtsX-like permease family protein [Cyclobacteriaceae bacterium]|nr:FtsX-like permease family protein [Cyclobacteriaceae bacterium]